MRRSYMVACVLAIAILRTATGYPIVREARNGDAGSTALTKNAEARVDTAPSQPGTRPGLESGLPHRTVVDRRPGLKEIATSPIYSTQPLSLHVRPSPLLAAVTPTPDRRPCYYLGIVAPGEMDKGILGPVPIPTPQHAPQEPGAIEYCHPAPPMAFLPGSVARTAVETPAPRP